MNLNTRIGVGVAATALSAVGATVAIKAMDRQVEHAANGIRDQYVTARGDWDTWKSQLDAEFPGMKLNSPADHARLDQFLAAHPAPAWVTVDHEDRASIHVDAYAPVDYSGPLDSAAPGAGIGLALCGGIGGGIALGAGLLGKAHSTAGTLGLLAGGAAALGAAAIFAKMDIGTSHAKADDGFEAGDAYNVGPKIMDLVNEATIPARTYDGDEML